MKSYTRLLSGLVVLLAILGAPALYAQRDSLPSPLSLKGYIETYYTYDANKSLTHTRPGFMYSFNKADELAVNLGYIKATYQTKDVRANLAFAAGTYMNANYAAETGVLKNIYEANAGVKISSKWALWLDAGILPSHIGFASAVGMDCWTLTRSLLADNSPYFETGVRLSYRSANNKWYMAALLLNGWQRIEMKDGNTIPSFGHQLTFRPNDRLTLNSSSFIGSDQPDSLRRWRFFHNLYAEYQLTDLFGLMAGFDIGVEQKFKSSRRYNLWYSPILIGRMTINDKSAFALRLEYYNDKSGVIIHTGTPNGFQTFGYSVNYDLKVKKNVLWRIEARGLSGRDKIFLDGNQQQKSDLFLTTSLAVSI